MTIRFFTTKTLTHTKLKEIRPGDICLIYLGHTIFLWVHNQLQYTRIKTESKILYSYCFTSNNQSLESNSVIFHYDGIKQRMGDLGFIESAITAISNQYIKSIFNNAKSILRFEEDKVDIKSIIALLKMETKELTIKGLTLTEEPTISQKDETKYPENEKDTQDLKILEKTCPNKIQQIVSPDSYYFYDIVDNETRSLWSKLYNEGKTTHEIYTILRKKDKEKFSSSFKHFIQQYPRLNLYSQKENIKSENTKTNKEICLSQEDLDIQFEFLFIFLESKGYIRKSDHTWVDKNGKEFIISIQCKKK